MRILLFGKNGQVGWELHRILAGANEVFAYDSGQADFTNPGKLRSVVRDARPHVIINAAAYTDVDGAEDDIELATAVNSTAPRVLAEEAESLAVPAALIHYSTDFVFDGEKRKPYTEEDNPNPINAYGKTKLSGEAGIQRTSSAYVIMRTSWVYSLRKASFVTKVLRWSRQQPTLRVVDDQTGSPTWCRTVAEATAKILSVEEPKLRHYLMERRGIYHAACTGSVTRLEWAKAILANDPLSREQIAKELLPAQTSEFPTPARRPVFSALNCRLIQEVFDVELPSWQQCLMMALGDTAQLQERACSISKQ